MMIDLVLQYKTPVNLIIGVLVAVACIFYAYVCFKRKATLCLIPIILINFVLLIFWSGLLEVDHDGSAHLHLSWLVSKGLIPYKDFWQHHPPLFWMLLAPVLKVIPHTTAVFDLSRIFSGCVFVINALFGWRIARQVWGEQARLSVYLLVLSSVSIIAEYSLLKPDIFMSFFLLAVVSLSIDIPEKRVFPALCAGVASGLAASFIFKQYLMYFLPVIAVFAGGKENRLKKVCAYGIGFAIGILPLISILIRYNIVRDYVTWVFDFNRQLILILVYFPLLICAIAVWGGHTLWKSYIQRKDSSFLIVLCALCLSTLSSLTTTTNVNGRYYLAFWFFLCAISASGCVIPDLTEKIPSLLKRSLVAGVILSLFLTFNLTRVWYYRKGTYAKEKKVLAQLMKYSEGQTCLVFLPMHPIFAFDATRLYSDWQYYYLTNFPAVKADAVSNDFAQLLIAARPAVVACRYRGRDLLLDLFEKKLIKAQGYRDVTRFFKENYTQKLLGEEYYYVRNDRL